MGATATLRTDAEGSRPGRPPVTREPGRARAHRRPGCSSERRAPSRTQRPAVTALARDRWRRRRLSGPVAPGQPERLVPGDRAHHPDRRRQRRPRRGLVPRPDTLGPAARAQSPGQQLVERAGRHRPDGQHDHAPAGDPGLPHHAALRPHRDVQRAARPRDLRLRDELLRHGPSLRALVAGRVHRRIGLWVLALHRGHRQRAPVPVVPGRPASAHPLRRPLLQVGQGVPGLVRRRRRPVFRRASSTSRPRCSPR